MIINAMNKSIRMEKINSLVNDPLGFCNGCGYDLFLDNQNSIKIGKNWYCYRCSKILKTKKDNIKKLKTVK